MSLLFLPSLYILCTYTLNPSLINFKTETGGIRWYEVTIFDDRSTGQLDHLFKRYAGRRNTFRPFAPRNSGHGKRQMLTVGVIHSAVCNHRDAVCFSDVTDFGCSGDAATPQNVWLEDVDQPPTLQQRQKRLADTSVLL